MLEIEKLPLTSMNIVDDQLQKLKELFPETFTEGNRIDWDKLRLTLGETIDTGKERYGMNWPGKADCFKTIQQPSIATLVPARDESIDFDTTENLFIEGDNLEVLKLLQKSYLSKVKMIYIDPPYNTGNEFIYPDNFTENLQTYLEYTGQVDSEGRKFGTNSDTDGRFHSKWINMMYPRLFLAKNLLREDGVIFISIDDNEVHNLKALCNEIFGEENFRSLIVRTTGTPTGQGNKGLVNEFDYVLCYSKSELFSFNGLEFTVEDEKIYDQSDNYGKYLLRPLRKTGGEDRREDRPSMFYEIESPDGTKIFPIGPTGYESRWRCGKETFIEHNRTNRIEWKKYDKGWVCYQKFYLEGRTKQPSNLWDDLEGNKKATREVKELLDGKIFDFPKPVDLLRKCLNISDTSDEIIMDFFCGSATTAHAVLELNKEKDSNRKFICVQLPEPTDEKSEAFKEGYKNIAEISKERIRRVIAKIEKEKKVAESKKGLFANHNNQENQTNHSSNGFKVFKLQPSNFKIWDANISKDPEVIQKSLFEHIAHINPESTQEAILYELLLKSGFELTTHIEKLILEGQTVFSIAKGELLICLEHDLTNDLIKAMAELQPTRVICLDEGFHNNDQLKTNAVQIMKSKGVVNFRTV